MAPQLFAGRYRLDTLLGEGGAAQVYQGWDERLQRFVAVKILRPETDLTANEQQSFLHEAQTTARLNHPGVVAVYDADIAEGRPYIVMELMPGGTLRQRLTGSPMPINEALRLAGRVADALEAAHRQRILHLDIKPENVLFDDHNEPKLSDFGIARALGDDGQHRHDGKIVGTAAYLAPEVVAGEPVDARADVYALGVMLYEMLTGQRPFSGATPEQQAAQRLMTTPTPPQQVNPAIPARLGEIVMQALARNPADRLPSAGALATALRGYAQGSEQRTTTIPRSDIPATPLPSEGTRIVPPPETPQTPQKSVPQTTPSPVEAPTRQYPRGESTPPATQRQPPPTPAIPTPTPQRSGGGVGFGCGPITIGLTALLVMGALFFGALQMGLLSAGNAEEPHATETQVADPEPTHASDPEPTEDADPEPTHATDPEPTEDAEPTPDDDDTGGSFPVPTPGDPGGFPLPLPTLPGGGLPPLPPGGSFPGSQGTQTIRLDDATWQGSYRRSDGQTIYGGRSATWIYGTNTGYDTMQASFQLAGQPLGAAVLTIDGMDSEDRAKTPISISINNIEIYRGRNPLPNDDEPVATGVWGTVAWRFDGALLQPGQNTITISTLTPGEIGRPPFFMLDFADLQYTIR
jgi:serine/threonine protein kinase